MVDGFGICWVDLICCYYCILAICWASLLLLSVSFLFCFFMFSFIYLLTYCSSSLKHSVESWSSSNSIMALFLLFWTHFYTIGTTPLFCSRESLPMFCFKRFFSSVDITRCWGSVWIRTGPVASAGFWLLPATTAAPTMGFSSPPCYFLGGLGFFFSSGTYFFGGILTLGGLFGSVLFFVDYCLLTGGSWPLISDWFSRPTNSLSNSLLNY